MGKLEPGDQFPDVTVESVEGPLRVREQAADGPLIVAFERHFG